MYKEQNSQLAILGGSFNPPHLGHLLVAKKIHSLKKFSKLIIIPVYSNPLKLAHKSAQITPYQSNLIIKTFQGLENTIIDWYNFFKPVVSYSFDDLTRIQNIYASKVNITFFMGSDAWLNFLQWKNYAKILEISNIAIFKRQGITPEIYKTLESYREKIIFYNWRLPNISSSQIIKNINDQTFLKKNMPPNTYNWWIKKIKK